MQLIDFQKGFNYSQDGPGNRLVYHLCGCNLRCPWCANPEGMSLDSLAAKREPTAAIEKAILSAMPMYFDGGGVTFTGGEPTLQLDVLAPLCHALQAQGVHVCIETNATSPCFAQVLDMTNVLIADLKHPDSELHRRWTGLGNETILKNLRMAAKTELPLQLRVPFIHGVNDDDKALEGFVSFFTEINRPGVTVEVLPYHEYGKDKWKNLGKPYDMTDGFVTRQQVEKFETACAIAGVHVVRT